MENFLFRTEQYCDGSMLNKNQSLQWPWHGLEPFNNYPFIYDKSFITHHIDRHNVGLLLSGLTFHWTSIQCPWCRKMHCAQSHCAWRCFIFVVRHAFFLSIDAILVCSCRTTFIYYSRSSHEQHQVPMTSVKYTSTGQLPSKRVRKPVYCVLSLSQYTEQSWRKSRRKKLNRICWK